MDAQLRNLPMPKKERERALLEALLRRLHLRPTLIEDAERPDFEITWTTPSRVQLGIELTELSTASNRKGSRYRQAEAKLNTLASALPANMYVELQGTTDAVLALRPEDIVEKLTSVCRSATDRDRAFTEQVESVNAPDAAFELAVKALKTVRCA